MAERFDDASKSQYGLKDDDDLETTRLAKDIRNTSRSLLTFVERMTYDLRSFVSILQKEKVQVTVQQEQSLAKQILTIFATLSSSTSDTARHHLDPKIQGSMLANTALGQAASEFCRMNSGAFLEHITPPARTEVIDSLMQNPRKGKSLRVSTR